MFPFNLQLNPKMVMYGVGIVAAVALLYLGSTTLNMYVESFRKEGQAQTAGEVSKTTAVEVAKKAAELSEEVAKLEKARAEDQTVITNLNDRLKAKENEVETALRNLPRCAIPSNVRKALDAPIKRVPQLGAPPKKPKKATKTATARPVDSVAGLLK